MKFRIIAVTLLATFSMQPAMAEPFNFSTIGDLRTACKEFLNKDSLKFFDSGACYGWIQSQVAWRHFACSSIRNDFPDSDITALQARDFRGHSVEALAQAFVNWADKYPEHWIESIYGFHSTLDATLWLDFWCEKTSD